MLARTYIHTTKKIHQNPSRSFCVMRAQTYRQNVQKLVIWYLYRLGITTPLKFKKNIQCTDTGHLQFYYL